MTHDAREITGGVDTHGLTHHAAVIDPLGRHLLDWMRSHSTLTAAGVTVVDVGRPDRKTRRMRGKSDPIDANAAATAVLSGRATGVPKSRGGLVEAVRVLRVTRRSASRPESRR
ncbi:hypothetical protein ACFU3O_37160 [Streptomyces antibioticus]|uniref:hypothetical protein n=1 Tax=Streptomyces antibioticus TaxID=1890 RepID=UPI0036BE1F22